MYICFIIERKYIFYIEPIIDILSINYHIVYVENIETETHLLLNAKLIITIHSFNSVVLKFLQKVKGIVKTLTIQDGIIEYKSSNHRFQGNYRFRPLYSDYIGCFGEGSKRLLLTYGVKENQIFLIGSPRFDKIEFLKKEKKYLLITMANRPGYGLENTINYYTLMEKLLVWLEKENINFKLRLSRGVSSIGQESIYKIFDNPSVILKKYFDREPSSVSLYEDLNEAYAVITTPSTVSLEAMLFKIPVVHLISDTVPINLQTVFNIYKEEDFCKVIPELKSPSSFKLLNQEMILNDNISYQFSSAIEIVKLIKRLLI